MIDIENDLNRSQADAVTYSGGPEMVIAGAGSGKTRVLTYRIAYLLEQGADPGSVLALTFTNKAAAEMKERIAAQVGEYGARYLWMGTFHSIFSRILRAEAGRIGYTRNFTIYDQSDSLSLIKKIIREMQLDEKVYKANVIQGRISNAKNRLMTADDYVGNGDIIKSDRFKNIGACGQIYMKYAARCRQSDVMDFDDLLLNTFLLFQQNEDVRARYADRFKFVLVDEYQDTNYAQHCIVWQLTRDNRQVCVVGDDAQSIYSFRGANIDNMLKFTQLYPGTKVVKLEQNYRSTQNIVGAANSLIDKNRNQIHKVVFSENEKGQPVRVYQVQTDIAEAASVSEKIERFHSYDGVDYGEMAVLYRTNGQSRVFEETFRAQGIPYKIYGSLSFYLRKEIKDVIAYFRLIANHNDEEALRRAVSTPKRGIGDTTVERMSSVASERNVSLWRVLSNPVEFGLDFNSGTLGRLSRFVGMIESFSAMADTENAYTVAKHIIDESGISRELSADRSPEGRERSDNVQELMNGIDSFCRGRMEVDDPAVQLTDYLSEVSLMTNQDNEGEDDVHKVTLMTVHAAKGLEFDTVFVVGMEENLFPNQMCMENERQLEEERRLFYVAITRAKRNCLLFFSKSRFIRGSLEMSSPSRFIMDIDPSYLEMHLLSDGNRSRFTPRGTGERSYYDSMEQPYGSERRFTTRSAVSQDRHFEARKSSQLFESRQEPVTTDNGTANNVLRPRNLQRVSSLLSSDADVSRVSASASSAPSLSVGNVIEHERFGVGEVLSVEGCGDGCKARIKFKNVGEKTLLLKFARFRIVEG